MGGIYCLTRGVIATQGRPQMRRKDYKGADRVAPLVSQKDLLHFSPFAPSFVLCPLSNLCLTIA